MDLIENYPIQDSRLIKAYELIDSGQISVLSLDIFDTLAWRKVPEPYDVFLILGRLFKKEGWLIDAVPAEKFIDLRMQAEGLARLIKCRRQHIKAAEVNLREIYWELSNIFNHISIQEMISGKKGIIDLCDVDELIALEVNLEKKLIVINPAILHLIHYAKQKQIAVIFVSNTYFEFKEISFFLEPPLNLSDYRLFLSCEQRVSKRHGLFSLILDELKIAANCFLHIGDNYESDYVAAQQAGLQALYYPKKNEEFSQIHKQEWPVHDFKDRSQLLDSEQGDFGLTFLRSKMSYHTELAQLKKQDAFYWKYGAMILGPVITGFIHWIYERCQALGQNRVFCLMREGRLYGDIIKTYAAYFPQHSLEAVELWMSRSYIQLATLHSASPDELFTLTSVHEGARYTLEEFCHSLGLDIFKIKKLLPYRYVKLDDEKFRQKIVIYLSTYFGEQIISYANQRRKNFLAYLLKTIPDLPSLSQMTLVDIGWSGTIQRCFQTILALEGYSIKVHGLYLGTTSNIEMPLLRGTVLEGYLLKAGFPEGATKAIKRGLYVLEQTATAGIGALADINEKGNVVNAKSYVSKKQKNQAEIIQKGIEFFCHILGKNIQNNTISLNNFSEALVAQLRNILIRACSDPTTNEAQAFEKWYHDHVSRKDASLHTLGTNQYYEKFIQHMLPEAVFEDWGITWPAGYAAKVDKSLASLVRLIRLNIIPPESLLSLDSYSLNIFIDKGKGKEKKAFQKLFMRSNPNRHFYTFTKLWSINKPIKSLYLVLDCPHSQVRINSLRLTIYSKAHLEATQHIFFESNEQESRIISSEPSTPALNTFICHDNALTLSYSFDIPDIYWLHINFCCEIWPLKG
jgi:predicted HAD superfamily hydrolase